MHKRDELLQRAAIYKGMLDELSCKVRYLRMRVEANPDLFDAQDIDAALDQYRGERDKYIEVWEQIKKEMQEYGLLQVD
jgi:uncharacterized coiled-coil DUF342 family protein